MRRTGCQCAEWNSHIPLFDACELVLMIPTDLCFLCFELLQPLGHICIDILHPAWTWGPSQTQTLKTLPASNWLDLENLAPLVYQQSELGMEPSTMILILCNCLAFPLAHSFTIAHLASKYLMSASTSVCLQNPIPSHKPCLHCLRENHSRPCPTP